MIKKIITVKCANKKCNKSFEKRNPKYLFTARGARVLKVIRGKNCKTCSPKCSKEYNFDQVKLKNKRKRIAFISKLPGKRK
jgi:hypothetical protein